ncbi:MFS transporter [Mycetocola spongiae]|uniref:MFS transporter n=1 Tax=Mycetocola spongiae TaxID=2859226 RepID=UPI001CF290C7|nr:MFS transporter [Mycetocola spongiae]UCR90120.1 MFS transporter [Mycetocola spongiae]
MPTLSPRAGFWTAAVVAALALWSSAAPTLAYPLYEAQWGLSPAASTWVFAAYPAMLIVVLILCGNLSDYIGRRATILWGLGAQLIGSLIFAGAPDFGWLILGRLFIGAGVGLALSPASVAMVEFSTPARRAASGAATTTATAVGLALATLVGGALIQYAPAPLHLSFLVLAGITAGVMLLASALPRHNPAEPAGRWRVRPIAIPRSSRRAFGIGALTISAAYLCGALILPLGAQIAHSLAGSTNTLVTGALMAVFPVMVAAGSLLTRGWSTRGLILAAGGSLIAGLWLFDLTGSVPSLLLYFAASALAGLGYGLAFTAGLIILTRHAPPQHRASMVSGGYLIGYLAQGIAAPVLGAIATGAGLRTALLVGAAAYTVIFMIMMTQARRLGAALPA